VHFSALHSFVTLSEQIYHLFNMLFVGRWLSFLVSVVVALLFVSSVYEYQSSAVRSRPQIWKAKEPSPFWSDTQLDSNDSHEDPGIIEDQVHSSIQPHTKPPPPFSRLRPQGLKDSKSFVSVDEYMGDILRWERPNEREGHWPPYKDFINRDYDPNRWEGFQLYVKLLSFKAHFAHDNAGNVGTMPTQGTVNSLILIRRLSDFILHILTINPRHIERNTRGSLSLVPDQEALH
jgi:hypothetical protein